jgi:glycine cleavage system H protein
VTADRTPTTHDHQSEDVMNLPEDRRYTREHEWIDAADPATVGITAHAADALGDVVYVDLPEVGRTVTAGEPFGEIESTKSVSDLYAPVDGEIVAVNTALADDPALVNRDPFGAGWLVRIQVTGDGETMDAAAYATLIG